ncbi:hypothetical protein NC653_007313 [Populus alba x Populus x berolinensis]|uniref:3'-5' exonuclease domain-containing protein n=1 Tax=Populus alba x Populus x berolinensis TaxID=444605 RepID=A0AAD6RH76_9ROSI|nr:hypothetical protein NC653_007313 [Populus alba x Populus x berolinensis]
MNANALSFLSNFHYPADPSKSLCLMAPALRRGVDAHGDTMPPCTLWRDTAFCAPQINGDWNCDNSGWRTNLAPISSLAHEAAEDAEKKDGVQGQIKITALTIASLAALSSVIFLITSSSKHYRRRRRKQQQKQSSSCYLQSHQKPQLSFKRVLLDNSFSQSKHLNLHGDHQKMSEFFSYVWIETETQLKDLAHTLSKHKVFAVDTEAA